MISGRGLLVDRRNVSRDGSWNDRREECLLSSGLDERSLARLCENNGSLCENSGSLCENSRSLEDTNVDEDVPSWVEQ